MLEKNNHHYQKSRLNLFSFSCTLDEIITEKNVIGHNNQEKPPKRCIACDMTSYREISVECSKTEMDQGKFPKFYYSEMNKWIYLLRGKEEDFLTTSS